MAPGSAVSHRRPSHRRLLVVTAAVLAVLGAVVLQSCGSRATTSGTGAGGTPTPVASSSTSAAPAPPAGQVTWAPTNPDPNLSSSAAPAAAAPVSVSVPSIGTDSPLIELATDPSSGVLVPPARYDIAGWFGGGPHPGDVGPAIIAGHVDSHLGPGVFFHLRDIQVGAQILVTRADTTVATFTVYAVGRYPKTEFPTQEVYGPTPDAELRLITCGGDFDYSARSYVDNIVAYARLSG